MAAGTLLYSTLGGLTASVIADFFHIGATILTIALFAPILVKTVGLDTVAAGMSSAHVDPWTVALTFGIPTAIGLLAGPFGDQSFWQRSFATNARHLRKAFTIAGFLFVLVPLSTGMLGFVAAGTGMEIENTQLANIAVINEYFPAWAIIPFTIMVIGALASTMDNCLVSGSTMMGHDLTDKGDPIRRGRIGGFAVAIIGLSIALIPGLTLIHLWLIYATMRAATLAPPSSPHPQGLAARRQRHVLGHHHRPRRRNASVHLRLVRAGCRPVEDGRQPPHHHHLDDLLPPCPEVPPGGGRP